MKNNGVDPYAYLTLGQAAGQFDGKSVVVGVRLVLHVLDISESGIGPARAYGAGRAHVQRLV